MQPNKQESTNATIDDLLRVLIPHSLRKQLNWEPGMALTFAVSKNGIEFSAHEGGAYLIDDFGRVKISKDLMETMGWNVGDKIDILPQVSGKGVVLIGK